MCCFYLIGGFQRRRLNSELILDVRKASPVVFWRLEPSVLAASLAQPSLLPWQPPAWCVSPQTAPLTADWGATAHRNPSTVLRHGGKVVCRIQPVVSCRCGGRNVHCTTEDENHHFDVFPSFFLFGQTSPRYFNSQHSLHLNRPTSAEHVKVKASATFTNRTWSKEMKLLTGENIYFAFVLKTEEKSDEIFVVMKKTKTSDQTISPWD